MSTRRAKTTPASTPGSFAPAARVETDNVLVPETPTDTTLVMTDYEGETGNSSHITRNVRGTLPVGRIANLAGARGEMPGEHRNRDGVQWREFLDDIAAHGIREPIFITVDHGKAPVISEGNHRRDAAVELGLRDAPVQVRYYGHAERDDTLFAAEPDAE